MLIGVNPRLTPDLPHRLAATGNADTTVLVDGGYAATRGRRTLDQRARQGRAYLPSPANLAHKPRSWQRRGTVGGPRSHVVAIAILWLAATLQVAVTAEPAREALATVKGVTLAFSLYGLIESLMSIPGVAHVEFDMERGLADIRLKPGATVTDAQIRQAITNASFTPGEIRWKSASPGDSPGSTSTGERP